MINEWRSISSAPTHGKIIVLAQEILDDPTKVPDDFKPLDPLITITSYHPDGGFTVCEIRKTTHWIPLPKIPRIFFKGSEPKYEIDPFDYNKIIPEIESLKVENHRLKIFLEKIQTEIENNLKKE